MGDQPSQKGFETRLAVALDQMDPAQPVLVEAESSKIGARLIPPSLWTAMCAAPRIAITADIATRTDYLTQASADVLADSDRLRQNLSPLRTLRGGALIESWMELIQQDDRVGLTRSLMVDHYDPAYAKSRKTIGADVLAEIHAETLDTRGITQVAEQIGALLGDQAS
jgi:tRNA 2-selenouridine synthase